MVLSVTGYGDMVFIGHLNQHSLQCNIDKFHLWDIFLQNNETIHALKIIKKPLNNTYNDKMINHMIKYSSIRIKENKTGRFYTILFAANIKRI